MRPDANRRDQVRVGADKCVVLNVGGKLPDPVVIAGDGAGADINIFPHRCIPEIGQVVELAALPDAALLGLGKIAHVDVGAEVRLWPDMRERSHLGTLLDPRGVGKSCSNRYIFTNLTVRDMRPRADLAPAAD